MTFGPADPNTVLSYFAAIAAIHRAAGHEPPTDDPTIARWKHGMRRTHGKPPDRKHPFLDRHYVAAIKGMPATAVGARDGAILALGLVTALRRSNLAALTVHDLRLDPEGFVVRVTPVEKRSRSARRFCRHPVDVHTNVSGCANPTLARDRGIAQREWRACPGPSPGHAALLSDRPEGSRRARTRADGSTVPLTADAIAKIVQRTAVRLGLDPSQFAAHSLRAGFLTSADAGGAALDESMDQSGHASRGVAAQCVRHGNPWKAGRARAARSLKL